MIHIENIEQVYCSGQPRILPTSGTGERRNGGGRALRERRSWCDAPVHRLRHAAAILRVPVLPVPDKAGDADAGGPARSGGEGPARDVG